MSNEHKPASVWGLVFWALVFAAGMTAVWFAAMVLVPSAYTLMRDHQTSSPAFFAFAFDLDRAARAGLFQPVVGLGCVLLILGVMRRRNPKISTACKTGLKGMGLFGLIVGSYMLTSAGIGMRMASIDAMRMRRIYEQALTDFALLESAQNRYDQIKSDMELSENLQFVAVKSVDEFTYQEASHQVTRLIGLLGESSNPAVRRRLLATLAVLRGKMKRGDRESRDIPRIASELGAPQTNDAVDALEWIAQTLNKDGWEPLPLLKVRVLP